MVVTRSATAARVDRERRTRYTYAPRSQPLLTDTIGYKYIDSYLEYDCLMTKEELSRLAEHKYSAIDTSWLDELFMKYYWEWVVNFYPLWLAPNLITLIGLIVNLITVFLLSNYCPTARETAPSWAYASAAFGLFVYQTLDATESDNDDDSKERKTQKRRSKQGAIKSKYGAKSAFGGMNSLEKMSKRKSLQSSMIAPPPEAQKAKSKDKLDSLDEYVDVINMKSRQ